MAQYTKCLKRFFWGSWSRLVSVGLGWHGLVSVGLGWHGLVSVGPGWHGLVSVGLGWSNLVASAGSDIHCLRQSGIQTQNIFDTSIEHVKIHPANGSIGLNELCSHYGLVGNPYKTKSRNTACYFKSGPLPENIKLYCAYDVECLEELREAILRRKLYPEMAFIFRYIYMNTLMNMMNTVEVTGTHEKKARKAKTVKSTKVSKNLNKATKAKKNKKTNTKTTKIANKSNEKTIKAKTTETTKATKVNTTTKL